MGINIGQVVRQWALREPTRTALVLADGPRQEVSFYELDQRARRAAAHLSRLGLAPGERVALSVPNGLTFVDGWFGALYAGLTVLPIPPMSAAPELAHRLAHAGVRAVLSDGHTHALVQEALRLSTPEFQSRAAARAHAAPVQALDARELALGSEESDGPLDLPASSVAMILYTSGTTGTAKGAQITHASLATHTAALVHHTLRLTREDVVLACLPLTHSYGIRMTLLAPFYAGGQSVLCARFAAAQARELMAHENVTWFPGVPTMFHALAHHTDAAPRARKLRWCLSAGAPLPSEVRLKAEASLGCKVRQGFGLTEATFTSIADPDDELATDTVGKPVFGVEVRIVDEQGKTLEPGLSGEVCVRGQNVMAGYLDDESATAEVMQGGWLHSGDVGKLDPDGRLTILDRIKDLIICGGFNVYPAEVEAALVKHESVRDAVVVARANDKYGEEVVAVLVLSPGATLDVAMLDAHCRAQLNRTKIPRFYGVLASLPVGASGKVLRREVRELVGAGNLTLLSPQ
jgi:long-chain acyl-CoA synthetase